MDNNDIDWYDILVTIESVGIYPSKAEQAALAVANLLGLSVPE